MKKKFLLVPVIAMCAYITMSSYSSGYTGGNRTGSDAGTVGCGGGGCHSSSASSGIGGLTMGILLDSAGTGTYVTKYSPGKTYIIRMYGANTTGTSLPKFGFQLSAVKGTGTASSSVGTYPSLPSTMTQTTMGGRVIVGHTSALDAVTVSSIPVDSVNIAWVAPAAGTGTVTMFGVINAVDNNGGATSADKWNNTSATFTELRDVTSVAAIAKTISSVMYPNPVTNTLNIQINNATAGTYQVAAFDFSGKMVINTQVNLQGNVASVDMSQLPVGMYSVFLEKEGTRTNTTIIKQ